MYIDELAKVAKEFAGLKPDTVIDDEERHYNREAVEKYEAVLAGGVYIHNHIMKKAREWFERNLYIHPETFEDVCGERKTVDWVTSDHNSVWEFINDFCKSMEE